MNLLSSGNFRIARRMLCGGLLALTGVITMRGQALIFPNFSSTSGLTLTSSSTTTTTADGSVLRLVSASTTNDVGGVFGTTQRTVTNGFSTAFDFRLTNPGGSSDGTAAGADGFVFTIQRVGVSALGASGEGIGFLNIGAASVGVEFDTFNNSGSPRFDPSSNHLGVDLGGSVTSVVTQNISPDFDNSTKWSGWIDYNGTTLEVRVSNTGVRPVTPNLSYTVSSASLQTTLGGTAAWVGFTAATGGAVANHDIVAWTFSDQYVPGGVTAGLAVPEPSTYAMLGLGLGVLIIARRRQLKRAR